MTRLGRGTFEVRTFGCQMNVHDSERIAGVLEADGWTGAIGDEAVDLVVFNTCAVRENADNRLYGNLGQLVPAKKDHPGMQIAVGGCLAQKDRAMILKRAPWVDVVFGTHNLGSLPALLERARIEQESQVELLEALETFPSTLPARRESAYRAWVSISVGCNNTCTFCIVPALRGRQADRRPGDILSEIEALAADGVMEVTLLGQNVNSYGGDFGDMSGLDETKAASRARDSTASDGRARDRTAFGKLLRAAGRIDGIERIRFTSPHPRDFSDDVIAAMAETPTVMPSLHMPLQSGSDRILAAMRRSYRAERYLAIIERVRSAMPDAAITTDVIVGFPGETEDDFAATLDVVERAKFAGAFTFQYSKRPGTPAAEMPGQVPPEVVAERYARLIEVVEANAWASNRQLLGTEVEVLVSEGEGRKDQSRQRISGRARDNRLVHLDVAGELPRPGDIAGATVTQAAPHHLVAELTSLRRTRGGDAWAARQSHVPEKSRVQLGMPKVGVPV